MLKNYVGKQVEVIYDEGKALIEIRGKLAVANDKYTIHSSNDTFTLYFEEEDVINTHAHGDILWIFIK